MINKHGFITVPPPKTKMLIWAKSGSGRKRKSLGSFYFCFVEVVVVVYIKYGDCCDPPNRQTLLCPTRDTQVGKTNTKQSSSNSRICHEAKLFLLWMRLSH